MRPSPGKGQNEYLELRLVKPHPEPMVPKGTQKERAKGTYLEGEEDDGGDAQPAMQGVEVCDF